METGLITNENKFIPIPYYEIGLFAENICKNFMEANEKNKEKFEVFAKNYQHFKPYFDFLLFELGYKMINPLLRKDSIWHVEENTLYLSTLNQVKAYRYVPVNDCIFVRQGNKLENLQDCVVDFYGVFYNVLRKQGLYHEDTDELILNQYLIYDKELFESYQKAKWEGLDIGVFCREMLGYSHVTIYEDQSGFIQYCSDFDNSYMATVAQEIKKLYPKIQPLGSKVHTGDSLTEAMHLIEKVGEKHENRRFRL